MDHRLLLDAPVCTKQLILVERKPDLKHLLTQIRHLTSYGFPLKQVGLLAESVVCLTISW